ncbi:MAG: HD domain-containing protein [Treponema sp.]|nr:HD domain-containing protein [Treponema sp.]
MEEGKNDFSEILISFEPADRERILKAAAMTGEESAAAETGIASILLDLNLDADTVIAALLAGNADQGVAEKIPDIFGSQTAMLLNGFIKISALPAGSKTIHEAENIRSMIFAMTDDMRVILIKLAEKLHSLRMNDSAPEEKRKALARECLDIYAPLAGRLGISRIKDEMEDISLKYLNREVYQQIKEIVAAKRTERVEFLSAIRDTLGMEAEKAGMKIDVTSRAKHFYSIYMKMRKRNKSAEEIFDLFGMRIICDTIEQCYTLLGIVHRLWRPVTGRFKDYIAMPKPNGYQSLHTTVAAAGDENILPEGRLLEIQIRTTEMHNLAENGIASHLLYKKGSTNELVKPPDIGVINRLKEWKDEKSAAAAWFEEIKGQILKNSIYVFTPQGKVIKLPSGATPIDFAYSVHSAIGEHCIGAKADGSIIQLGRELHNTQMIEILTSPSAHPNIGWLSMAKTARARNRIRAWLGKNDESAAAEKNAPLKKKNTVMETPPADTGAQAVQRVMQDSPSDTLSVRIDQEKNMMVHFARCCRPVTGDSITGYVSRGRGIIIHRKSCSNLVNIPDFSNRQIKAEWENAPSALVKRFRVEAKMQANLFSEIEGAVRKYRGHLLEGRLEENTASRLCGLFTMRLEQAADIKPALKNIRGIPGIISLQPLN